MCFPHVINICSQHVISTLDPQGQPLSDTEDDTSHQAFVRDPISLGRQAVRGIRASGQRRDAFSATIQNGNEHGWFTNPATKEIIKVPEYQLLRDVKTRWDSVYYMINRLRILRPVRHSHSHGTCMLNWIGY